MKYGYFDYLPNLERNDTIMLREGRGREGLSGFPSVPSSQLATQYLYINCTSKPITTLPLLENRNQNILSAIILEQI